MRPLILIIVIVSFVFSMDGTERIDSILTKARNVRNEGVKGFIVQQNQQKLLPPDELFGEIERVPESMDRDSVSESGREVSSLLRIDPASNAESPRGLSGGSGGSSQGGTLNTLPRRTGSSFVSIDRYGRDRESNLREITELKLQVDRLATAVGYVVENSTDQKKMIELLTKFMEVLTPLLVAIGGMFGWSKVRKQNGKKKKEAESENGS